MLDIVKTITFTGTSKIDSVPVKVFSATINTENPEEMPFNHYVVNQSLYKSNRKLIGTEQSEFEDMAFAFQDQLLEEKAAQL